MPIVNITRGPDAVSMYRSQVKTGQVFAVRKQDGKMGTPYAAIGHNGRMYSVNTKTGELASSCRDDKPVVLLGTFKFVLDRAPHPAIVRTCRRSGVRSGEVFNAVGKDITYLNIGHVEKDRTGWLSIPYNNTENHAIGESGDKNVNVTGTFTIQVTMTK